MTRHFIPLRNKDRNGSSSEPSALFKSPVFWAAFAAAIVAALANAYVAYVNNNTLLDIETHKENEEQFIEGRKAEFTRLLEISKLDAAQAKLKVQALCEMLLITDQPICLASAKNGPSPPLPPATWDSEWAGGGHNQQEMCASGALALGKTDPYRGKVLSLQSASEDSKKDIFGHVEYRYHCTYRVSDASQEKR